jgi:hypothetical protein
MAPRDVVPALSYSGQITRAIKASRVMVLIFSEHSNISAAVLAELELAANADVHILNFRVDATPLGDDLLFYLQHRHWLDALTPPMERHHARLVQTIQGLLAPASTSEEADLATPTLASPMVLPRKTGGSKARKFPLLLILLLVALVVGGTTAILRWMARESPAPQATKSYQSPMRVAAQATSTTSPAAETKAAPVEKLKRLERPQRSITVLKPGIELPAMKAIVVVAAKDADNPNAAIRIGNAGETDKYNEPIRIPPDVKTEKFDVVWLPKDGRRIILVRDLAFDQEHSSHEIKPDEYIGLVRLGGKDLPKATAIYLAEPGDNKMTVPISAVQKAKKYGEDMAAPPGTYDIYIDVADEKRRELVAEKLEVKAGRVTEVE